MAQTQLHEAVSHRQAILDVAARIFAAKGYDAASMREIAEGAGVTKPTVYYYFKSKEGLLEALLEIGVSFLCGNLQEINARDASADPVLCLEDAVYGSFRLAMEHGDLNRFVQGLVFGPQLKPQRKAIEAAFSRVVSEFYKVLSRAVGAGLLDAGNIGESELALRGAMLTYVVNYLQGRIVLTRDLAERLVHGFLYGYGSSHSCPRESESL